MGYYARKVTIRALGNLGTEGKMFIPLLRKCMETDRDEGVRSYAKEAIEKILHAKPEDDSGK